MSSQIIGLCDECIREFGHSLDRLDGRVFECMACDKRESPTTRIVRVRVTPADFERLADQA